MNRLLSILLIPLFVLGQALPHSHAGSGVSVPNDHAARPHVHLPGGHSHHHAGDDHDHDHSHSEHVASADSLVAIPSFVALLPDEHDSDAIYVAQSNCVSGRGPALGQLSSTTFGTFVDVLADRPAQPEIRCYARLSDRFAGLPIYLLIASLRL